MGVGDAPPRRPWGVDAALAGARVVGEVEGRRLAAMAVGPDRPGRGRHPVAAPIGDDLRALVSAPARPAPVTMDPQAAVFPLPRISTWARPIRISDETSTSVATALISGVTPRRIDEKT